MLCACLLLLSHVSFLYSFVSVLQRWIRALTETVVRATAVHGTKVTTVVVVVDRALITILAIILILVTVARTQATAIIAIPKVRTVVTVMVKIVTTKMEVTNKNILITIRHHMPPPPPPPLMYHRTPRQRPLKGTEIHHMITIDPSTIIARAATAIVPLATTRETTKDIINM